LRLTLRTKAALLTTTLVLVLVGAAGWWQYRQITADYLALLTDEQQALTDAAAADLDYKLGMHLAIVARAARLAQARAFSDPEAQQRFLAENGLRPMFDGVALIALDGSILASDPPNDKASNIGDRDYFRLARDAGLPAVSAPLIARTTNRPEVLMVAPVKADDGRIVGVVAAGIGLDRADILGDTNRRSTGRGSHYVVLTRGPAPVIVMHPNPDLLLKPASRADVAETGGAADVVTRARIASTDWELRVVRPALAAYAPLDNARRNWWFQLLGLGVACAVGVWSATAWLIRPLETLVTAMRTLRRSPDSPIELGAPANDERGDLAREFEALMTELREQRVQMAAVTDASPIGLFRTDADGRMTYVNDAYLAIHGFGREAAAEGWLTLVPEGIRDRVRADWQRVVREAKPLRATRRLRRADGREVLVSVRSRPVFVAGRVAGHAGTVSDITERAAAERALRTLGAIFDATTDYVVQTDAEGRLIYLNPAARWRIGRAPDAPIEHLTMADLNPPQTVERYRLEIVPAAVASGVWVGESVAWDAEHHEVPVSHLVIAHRDKHGKVEYFSALMRDISAAKDAERALRDSEHRLRMVTDHLPVLISYLDRELCFRFVNQTYAQWFGADAAPMIGTPVRAFYGEAAWAEIGPRLRSALAGQEVTFEREMRRAGQRRCVQVTAVPDRNERGEVVGLYTLDSDITAYRDAERALQESEARLRTVADVLPMRVAYIDADERYRFNNLAYERDFGISRDEIQGRTVRELLGEAAYAAAQAKIRSVLAGQPVTFQGEMATGDSHVCYEAQYIPQFAADATTVLGFHAVITDITRQKLEERRLVELARVDTLTGVVNRSGFELRLDGAMARCRSSGELMALMYLDIDRFKEVNDRFGHVVGDALLKAFAGRLAQALRSTDTVARLGGDEFTVILEGLPRPEVAAAVAAKIIAAMGQPFVVDEQPLDVTTSIGLTFYRGGPGSAADLVRQADKLLYEAKASGRNAYQVDSSLGVIT
jgi:diguanylate cyclase (GGDEF)-like protein/PAS domain S-box-containing protein